MGITVNNKNCDKCGECVRLCPFAAIEMVGGFPVINAACKVCGICIKECGQSALILIDDVRGEADKGAWSGILVYGEMAGGRLHPVVRELVGKAHELAGGTASPKSNTEIYGVVMGEDTAAAANEFLSYGVDRVLTYEHEIFGCFRADSFSVAFADAIEHLRPSIVLTGATSIGRSLAPRTSTRLRTGLTADCTALEIKDGTDLVQIRPAFGGNIMAEIVTPRSRPQFATVRYKVMDEAPLVEPHGSIVPMKVTDAMKKSGIDVISVEKKPPSENISEAEVLVVGGKGLKSRADLETLKKLADRLGGQYAVTRPLVEAGWAPQSRQIGLSGRTVKPKVLLAFGVSGAVQFTAAIKGSERIFAVNTDPGAPIMDIAHYGVIGDLYEIIPGLLESGLLEQ
ncbi:MAG: electron transfer flavoprotein subunit alpha [Clostridiales bacterium]|nr:electron transfer flavoprotein subunit alpha [Clostridiales bacterium]